MFFFKKLLFDEKIVNNSTFILHNCLIFWMLEFKVQGFISPLPYIPHKHVCFCIEIVTWFSLMDFHFFKVRLSCIGSLVTFHIFSIHCFFCVTLNILAQFFRTFFRMGCCSLFTCWEFLQEHLLKLIFHISLNNVWHKVQGSFSVCPLTIYQKNNQIAWLLN